MLQDRHIQPACALDLDQVVNRAPTDLHQLYDELACDWYRDVPSAIEEIAAWPVIVQLVKEFASGGVVLDAGCGTGNIARLVSPFVRNVIGLDLSRRMLAEAQMHAPAPKNILYVSGDIRSLSCSVAIASVDMVLSIFAHCCVESESLLRKALCELREVLKPAGCVLLQIPNPFQHMFVQRSDWHHDLNKPVSYCEEGTLVRRKIRLSSGKWITVSHYHFRLVTYMAALIDNGFTIDKFYEPEVPAATQFPQLPPGNLHVPSSFLILARKH